MSSPETDGDTSLLGQGLPAAIAATAHRVKFCALCGNFAPIHSPFGVG